MAADSRSWWVRNGFGCHADSLFADNVTALSSVTTESGLAAASYVSTTIAGCIISYEYVEVLHASLQCLLVVSSQF